MNYLLFGNASGQEFGFDGSLARPLILLGDAFAEKLDWGGGFDVIPLELDHLYLLKMASYCPSVISMIVFDILLIGKNSMTHRIGLNILKDLDPGHRHLRRIPRSLITPYIFPHF